MDNRLQRHRFSDSIYRALRRMVFAGVMKPGHHLREKRLAREFGTSPVAYHALKAGIIHMTRHLAVYWARDGVRVNCLSPGPFLNEGKVPRELVVRYSKKSPMQRIGRPQELKGAIVFLASDASSYMTGQNLVIDGGWTSW